MNTAQHRGLLFTLKALADEQRLRIFGYMNERERNVTELAELLQLSEPTISHHISKLHEVGLLTLRMAGNQRFYSINRIQLAKFKALVNDIEQLPVNPPEDASDESWIDALDWNAEDKKTLHDFTKDKRIIDFPTKEKKWLAILRWVATYFEPDKRYTEKQVNAILSPINADYATLRRNLIEYGFMRRERGGGDYWLTPEVEEKA